MTVSKNRTQLTVKIIDAVATMSGANPDNWTGTHMQVQQSINGHNTKYNVRFNWSKHKGVGKPTSITIDLIGNGEISSDLLRALPLKKLKDTDTQMISAIMQSVEEGMKNWENLIGYPLHGGPNNPGKTVQKAIKKMPRKLGTRIDQNELVMIAQLWKKHKGLGTRNISDAIADELQYAASTIRKRIQQCRDLKLIPPLPKTKKNRKAK